MGKNSSPFIATKQKITNMKKAGYHSCSGCGDGFVEGDVIVPTTNDRFHFRCAKCRNIL